jgi:esterase/lipase superfamily enzyme
VRTFVRNPSALFPLIFALFLAGCASRPHGFLIPVATTAPGASQVDMLVMTTREQVPTPGEIYSGERAAKSSLANLIVSIPPDNRRTIGNVQWPTRPPGDPATDFVTLRADPAISVDDAKSWFRRVGGRKRKVLVFVHGFNNLFEESVYRFAQIVHDSGTEAAPVLFTWPSSGKARDYVYDKESATYSRDALETLLTRAASDPNVSDVTVMAHSMGNWVMVEALRQMSIRNGRLLPKIKNIIMAAPDLDVDVFRSQFLSIKSPRPRFTLFVSRDDGALSFSRFLGGGVDRLGEINPDVEPYRSKLAAAEITVIDLTKLKVGEGSNHSKFAESPEIVRLIGRRLIEGQEVASSEFSLGERIIQPVLDTVSVH